MESFVNLYTIQDSCKILIKNCMDIILLLDTTINIITTEILKKKIRFNKITEEINFDMDLYKYIKNV